MEIIGRLLDGRHCSRPAISAGAERDMPSAQLLGLRMAALYCYWQNTAGPDLVRLAAAFITHIGLTAGTPIARTCLQAAAAVAKWQGRAYHSARHHAEVATNAMVLAAISARQGAPVSAHDLGILLAAALAHDIDWQPTPDQRSRFAAEAKSAAVLDRIAAACGLGADDRRAIRVLVMATEPYSRAGMAALLAAPDRGIGLPSGDRGTALSVLAAEPSLLHLASLLSDADLLSSAGLTRAWSRVQWQRLARESERPAKPADWEHFFDAIVGADFLSRAGRHFSANLARIRNLH